jgi:hypothetical protein
MPIDNTLTLAAAAAEIAERILVDLAVGGREADDAASFAQGLQDGLLAAAAVVHSTSPGEVATPAVAELLARMDTELRFRLGLS